jgi:protein-S-isoprenylcysteine O-methyltransferase Ste14
MPTSKLILGILYNLAIFGGLLFVPAGTLRWWRAWVFLGVVLIGSVATMVSLLPDHADLLNERFKSPIRKGQPLADKIIVVLLIATFLSEIIFIPLDVFRFHLLGKPGAVISSLGLVLHVVGWVIISLTFKENAFAIAAVKLQTERQHKVIDTGVYVVVRHPMYAGAILYFVGIPLWLESYAAALLAVVPIGLLALRCLIEEGFLRRELPGYAADMAKVRYRLLPFVW